MKEDCVFCKISDNQIPSKRLLETDALIVIEDIAPQAAVHLLVIPKKHLCCWDSLEAQDAPLLWEIACAIQEVTAKLGISGNYRIVNNCGETVGQTVQHLHLHILSNGDRELPSTMC